MKKFLALTVSIILSLSLAGCGNVSSGSEVSESDNISTAITSKNETSSKEELKDSDGDGLADEEERKYRTDSNNKDTDNDGLSDGDEVLKYKTDPLRKDTDGDHLSDKKELELKTDPNKEDSDDDGLNDYDEMVLKTDPLKKDTDGNGTSDSDEYFEQNISKDNIDNDLFKDNDAVLSQIKIKAKGNVNGKKSPVHVSEYNGYLKGDERSYVGKCIEIKNADIKSGKIKFKISKDYKDTERELRGEKRNVLLICYNDGENETEPLETKYDKDKRTLTADIKKEGIYFVLNVCDWMESLGIDPETGEIM